MNEGKKSKGHHFVLRRFTVLAMVLAFSLGLTTMAMAIELKFHHDLPEDSAQHLAAEKFKAAVESRTNGEIQVKIFPNNALGDDVEATQQMQFGAIQGAIIPTAKLSNFVPATAIGRPAFPVSLTCRLHTRFWTVRSAISFLQPSTR